MWLEISSAKCKPFLLNFIYRPPNSKQNWVDLNDALFLEILILIAL